MGEEFLLPFSILGCYDEKKNAQVYDDGFMYLIGRMFIK